MDDVQDVPSSQTKEVEELKKQLDEVTNNWKRAVADYQNMEKRVEREREDFAKFFNLQLVAKLVGVLENLKLAASHLNDGGLDITVKELKDIISEQGVSEIEVGVGDNFDPNFQECVELVAGEEDQKVVAVIASGYIIGDRVIRPAKVKVSKL